MNASDLARIFWPSGVASSGSMTTTFSGFRDRSWGRTRRRASTPEVELGSMATAKASVNYPHVTKTPGVCGGKACIDGTRIRVNNVVFLHKDGAYDEKILEAYPDLTPAQIHAALAYYYDNREEIDAELAADKSWAESLDR